MNKRASKALTLVLAGVASLAFAETALAQQGTASSNETLENARNSQPKYGGSAGYRMSDGMKLRARYDYGFNGGEAANSRQSTKEQRAIQQDSDRPNSAHQHNGNCTHSATGPKPLRPVLVKDDAPGSAPRKPGMMNGPKKPAPNFEIDLNPFNDKNAGAFTEVGGLEFEEQPIEYREGANNDYNKTKQPGMQKYSDVTLRRPKDNGEFADAILTDVKFRIEVEEVKRKYYPEKKARAKPVRGR